MHLKLIVNNDQPFYSKEYSKGRFDGLLRIRGLTENNRTIDEYKGLIAVFKHIVSLLECRIKWLERQQRNNTLKLIKKEK